MQLLQLRCVHTHAPFVGITHVRFHESGRARPSQPAAALASVARYRVRPRLRSCKLPVMFRRAACTPPRPEAHYTLARAARADRVWPIGRGGCLSGPSYGGVEGRELIKGMDRLSKRSWQLSDLSGRSAMLAQGGCMQKKEPRRALGESECHLRGASPKRAFLAKAVF